MMVFNPITGKNEAAGSNDDTGAMYPTSVNNDGEQEESPGQLITPGQIDNPPEAGQGWTQDEFGNWYKLDSSGDLTFKDDKGTDYTYDPKKGGFVDSKGNLAGDLGGIAGLIKRGGQKLLDAFKDKNGNVDFGKLLTMAGGAYAASRPSGTAPTGYQGKIPKLTASRNMLTAPPVGRRPGSGGIDYGGGTTYRDEKGNIVSSNERTLEELRQAAINNPFNRGATYEGQTGLGQSDLITLLNSLNPPGTTPTTPTTPVVGGGTVVGGGATTPTGTKPATDPTARYNSINEFLRTNPSPEALAAAQKQYGVSNEELAAARKYGQERYNSINQFLGTNPSPEALAAAQKQYGVSDAELAEARKNKASGPTSSGGLASVPSQYGAIARPGYQQTPYTGAREGTKLPDGRILTAQGIYDPKTGDVLTPDGYRVNAFGGSVNANKDIVSKEDAELMKGLTFSMDPNREATPEEVKNYIQWQMTQPNPLGQGTLGDLYAKQGITDPYNSPIVQQQAQEQLKRQDRRDAMYAATQKGLDPTLAHSPQGYGMWEDPNWLAKQNAANTATAQRNQQQTAAAPNVTVGGGIAGPATAPRPAAPPPDVNDWAQTQQGQAAGGISSVYDSINRFLATNPSQEALGSAMRDFGVDQSTLDAARSYAAPANPEPVVVGPGPAPAPVETFSYRPEPAPVVVGPGPAPVVGPGPAPEPVAAPVFEGYGSYYDHMAGGYAKGGLARDGFVVPADVVSHFGNGSSEAGLKLLASKIGATPIKGDGDGMSDSIPTKIDGVQEARVANDEAYVSPEMVAKLGNGSPEKGARKLYAMMDKIRKARTGSTEQGKEIDPNKYMPGGSVQRYAVGGTTVPTGATGSESSLSNWAGDYVTNMLGQGAALANAPYQAYTGPLTAGASGLQQQAFGMAGNLQTPGSIGQAAGTAGGIANLAANMRYTPQTTDFLGGANVSGLGMAPSYGMGMPQQQAPANIQTRPAPMPYGESGPTTFSTKPLRVKEPAQHEIMYAGGSRDFDETTGTYRSEDGRGLYGVKEPAQHEIMYAGGSRDFDESAPFMQEGAMTGGVMRPPGQDVGMIQDKMYRGESPDRFAVDGGMTGGVMRPPGQEAGLPSLMQARQPQPSQPVGNIAQQYMNPYLESALRPQMAEMQRSADIARMSDAARLAQAGAFGGSRQAIMESEGRRNLLGKQSDVLAQGYSTAYDKAMQQFNADQARRAQEAQFGATFGLQGLQTGIQGAQAQAQAGALQSQADLANLRGTLEAGGVERGIESEGIAADKAQFEEARLNPYKMLQFQQSLLSGLPLAAQSYSIPGQSNLQQFAGGATTIQQLLDILSGKTTATKKP